MFASLWIFTTIAAAGCQSLRNALQRGLTVTLGTVGATHVRFLFGLPFAFLFLAVILTVTGAWPHPTAMFWVGAAIGGIAQILATAFMLHAMRERSFLVTIAYTKTEPVQVALFGLIFLSEVPTPLLVVAIAVATAGVMVLSWPKAGGGGGGLVAGEAAETWVARLRPALLGIASGAFFGISAVAFKVAIRAAGCGAFLPDASAALAASLTIQTAILTVWLVARDRGVLVEIMRAWRPSLAAGFLGALASQLWFTGFAIAPVAAVRTLGLSEILFAQVLSRRMMKERPSRRELIGIALLVVGVLLVLNS
jgi:drug/metabolite transporter (DMT)-like permease